MKFKELPTPFRAGDIEYVNSVDAYMNTRQAPPPDENSDHYFQGLKIDDSGESYGKLYSFWQELSDTWHEKVGIISGITLPIAQAEKYDDQGIVTTVRFSVWVPINPRIAVRDEDGVQLDHAKVSQIYIKPANDITMRDMEACALPQEMYGGFKKDLKSVFAPGFPFTFMELTRITPFYINGQNGIKADNLNSDRRQQ